MLRVHVANMIIDELMHFHSTSRFDNQLTSEGAALQEKLFREISDCRNALPFLLA